MIFLKILFLGKVILLTPVPVDIHNQWLELKLDEPIKAITGGASLNIQIPSDNSMLRSAKGATDVFSKLDELFPKGTLVAKLIDSDGNEIFLSDGNFSITDFTLSKEDSVRILMTSDKPIPTDVEFMKIKIMSNIELKGVKIYWKNFKH